MSRLSELLQHSLVADRERCRSADDLSEFGCRAGIGRACNFGGRRLSNDVRGLGNTIPRSCRQKVACLLAERVVLALLKAIPFLLLIRRKPHGCPLAHSAW